jgi:truncated hemoglobin YjbI
VIALVRGGLAVMDERLFVGDIIIAVDGIDVRGKKAVSAMDEKATQYTFTVLRSPDVVVGGGSGGGGGGGASADGGASGGGRGDAGGGASGPDMDGWLTKVKAQDGRALKMPEKRWVVLQGSTLHWYKDSKCEMLANSQHIGSCELTMPRKGADAADLQNQAMAAFAKLRKYPFMLSWPNKEVKHDLVFAASTSADRAAWAQALRDAIQRAKVSAPSAGWLCKEGGRRTGLSLSSWKRRWFVLNQGSSELRYFESPSSTTYKGVIPLHNSDVFVPKQVKGLKSQYSINLCIASERPVAKGKETHMCTLLAAATHEERDSWLKSLTDACKRGGEQRKAAPASAAAAASGGAPPTAAQAGPRVDVGAGAMEQGNAVNLEQIILLEVDVLLTLRIKQLKDVLRHMGVDFSNAVEKKDLVALVVKHREGRK